MNNLFYKFKRDIYGLVWLALAIFLFLALYSFNPSDPSFNSVGANTKALNHCGYFGSFLSDLLFQFFGLVSWLLVLGALRLAYFSFRGREVHWTKARIFWGVIFMTTLTSLSELYFPQNMFFGGEIRVGGILGELLVSSLIKLFNFAGVALILWSTTIILVVFYTERTLKDIAITPIRLARSIGKLLQNGIRSKFIASILTKIRSVNFFNRKKFKIEGEIRKTLDQSRGEIPAGFFKIKKETGINEGDREIELNLDSEGVKEGFSLLKKITRSQGKSRKPRRPKIVRRVENWNMPTLDFLNDPPKTKSRVDDKEIRIKARLLTQKFEQFNVGGEVVGIRPGPAVTLFEFKPNIDVKISKITDLADDLCLALSSESVRIIAPIPGRDVVGIETSNSFQETVYLKDIISEDEFWGDMMLPIPLGRQADGEPKVVDLRKMPHLLVAGTTGSGKSVFVVSTLTALLFKHSPKTLKLILIDPKQVDLTIFNHIPHLIMPPIREPKKAVVALRWAIKEMDKRYRSMSKFGARSIDEFNKKVSEIGDEEKQFYEEENRRLEEESKFLETFYWEPQAFVVIIVEEFGDLMAVDKANVEHGVVRLAQMARASGMHLILAMQSPRKDVVTGLIKTNIPGRISFKVSSKLDSRIILDESGGERLLARGDMLFLAPGISKPKRHHGAWLCEDEINGVVDHWKDQGEPIYDPLALKALEGTGGGYDFDLAESEEDGDEEGYDERYDEIVSFVSGQKSVSASLLQRRFRLGYPRAARIIELMESEGVIGPPNGSKPREVLISEFKD